MPGQLGGQRGRQRQKTGHEPEARDIPAFNREMIRLFADAGAQSAQLRKQHKSRISGCIRAGCPLASGPKFFERKLPNSDWILPTPKVTFDIIGIRNAGEAFGYQFGPSLPSFPLVQGRRI